MNYEFRMHDPRVGRFLSLDPLAPQFPHNSPYAFSENRVIDGVELEGLEHITYTYHLFKDKKGVLKYTTTKEVQERTIFFTKIPKQVTHQVEYKDEIFNFVINKKSEIGKGPFDSIEFTPENLIKLSNNPEQLKSVSDFNNELLTTAAMALAVNSTGFGERMIKPLPSASKSKLPVEESAPKIKTLDARAKEIHDALPVATQKRTTTAVAEVTNPDGTKSTLVGSSEVRLRPAQRKVLTTEEIAVKGSGHAEQTVINHANANGQKVNAVGASRPICENCEKAINKAGAKPVGKLKGK